MSRLWLVFGGSILIASMIPGCEVRPKPVQQTVEYRSALACVPRPQDCPWANLERQAKFAALVNCLLAGATALRMEEPRTADSGELAIVAPVEPRYGYSHATDIGTEERTCHSRETVCKVASRHERALTWATCGTQFMKDVPLRGGNDLAHADKLSESAVLTGRLTEATNEFRPPHGLDGPDHFYTFTLIQRTRMEIMVAVNTSYWSNVAGLVHAPWQPALYLLSADGATIKEGQVFRAGVTYLFPADLQPGTYYVVVDSSLREWSRGDGLYRLYVGLDQELMGPLVPSP